MVVVSPNLEYGPYGNHSFESPTSSSTPSVQLIHLLQDGLVKSCDDQSMLSHKTLGIPHIILYLS